MSTPLPYVFDLLYDLKTLEQLNDHLSGRQRYSVHATDAELYAFALQNNVTCDGSKVVETAEMRMVTLLKHLTKPECGVMPDLVLRINELLEEVGHGHH